MFDPTVYDNLKVALENLIYDLDNLDGRVRVADRTDRLEMSVLSRTFAIRFHLAERPAIMARIGLEATLRDLAAEILEMPGEPPACALRVSFHLETDDIEPACSSIASIVQEVWGAALSPRLRLSFDYGQPRPRYRVAAELPFDRKINEDQMEDLSDLVDHALRTLERLQEDIGEV
ncbi:hypothetical protein [Cohnella nanjingensis]|uniref:Uncharacterized protein n=1 Tax=Cohnella nanjingensis TaxID=1387779 RepID=A0A7X0RUC4_9BACL|nr:hypothetical protein [Cohnella nanjingensis]MBB6673686.1 hypothetical protein [Cohnella nanjingensis]